MEQTQEDLSRLPATEGRYIPHRSWDSSATSSLESLRIPSSILGPQKSVKLRS
jgi:hypothetical protein